MANWKAVFNPAITFLNRLGYTQKFTLIWVVSFGALVVMMISLYASLNQVIQPALKQSEGLKYLAPVMHFSHRLRLHKDVIAAFSPNEEVIRKHAASHWELTTTAFDNMAAVLPSVLRDSEEFKELQASWLHLYHNRAGLPLDQRFALYSRLLNFQQQLQVKLIEEYQLLETRDASTHYLIAAVLEKLPNVIHYFEQLRVDGSRLLVQHSPQGSARQLEAMARIDLVLNDLNQNLRQIRSYSPELKQQLQPLAEEAAIAVRSVRQLQQQNQDVEQYFQTLNRSIDLLFHQMHDQLLPLAAQQVAAQAEHARSMLRVTVGIAAALFLLVVYFSVSMYYAIIQNIRQLQGAARRFSQGDTLARVTLQTEDELRLVAEGFNRMAEGFGQMLQAHQEDGARVYAAVEMAMDAVVQMDADGRIIGWNLQAEQIFGWSSDEVMGQLLHEVIIPPQYREGHVQGLQRFLTGGEPRIANSRVEMHGLHQEGYQFPIELSVTPIKLGDQYEFSAFIRDITDKKQSDELIWRQANLDNLTGLPNRHMFYDRLLQDIKRACRAQQELALFFIDLDKFKEVNDTLGHGAGDILLVEAASRIGSCVRETDTVARLGGDEFVVILREIDDLDGVERVANCILEKLTAAFMLQHDTVYISASIGITLYPNDAMELEELLRNADQAMYASKERGRNCFSYFTASMQQAMQIRLRLINDLRQALALQQLEVYYQPIVDLLTGRVSKAEALIRWHHPEYGLVNPDRFIPLSEETGLIVEIGEWVLKQGVQQLKQWQQHYDPRIKLSINMSPVQFYDAENPCQKWQQILADAGISPDKLVIEITEGLLLDSDTEVKSRLAYFREAGVQIAIDDFGTGYSSLSYLKKFDIDYLKIDRSFVSSLEPEDDNLALVEAIIVMSHKLGLKVTAEGVETPQQIALLDAAGCDALQGYYFSMPVPAGQFAKLLQDHQHQRMC